MKKSTNEIAKRFWARVDRSGECWVWTRGTRKGYGILRVNWKKWSAHRLAYELTFGSIPAGLKVCHTCDNPPCCRPDHLFLGKQKQNLDDMREKGRTSSPVQLKGTRNLNAKLNEEAVRAIRWLRANGVSMNRIAKAYNVHSGTIGDIDKGISWSWVE